MESDGATIQAVVKEMRTLGQNVLERQFKWWAVTAACHDVFTPRQNAFSEEQGECTSVTLSAH